MHVASYLAKHTPLSPPFTCTALSGGNMNQVVLVQDALGNEVVLKYAPPYLHLLGPSFALTQERISVEMHALAYFASVTPSFVPRLLQEDEANHCMLLEYKKGFVTLREAHLQGDFTLERYTNLGAFVGALATHTPAPKPVEFYENATLKSITDAYVFTIAFLENSPKTVPHPWFTPLPKSARLLENVAFLKTLFHTPYPHLIHGDLHTGSVLVRGEEIAVIDAEFALFGPVSFDLGNVMAHLVMDSFGRDFPRKNALEGFWDAFVEESVLTCKATKEAIFSQSVGFCGVEIARRLVVPAKSPALESLAHKEKAYAHMDALSHRLIENFKQIKTLQDFLGVLP
ncbi:MAG: phosphotransferase [Campylobacterales bacterium]|nr:phosphotransferase [Campylobacterales bacterium]